ncbi:dihydropteroate synthase [Alcaligenaceae bacterium LF4-65]|jgi:dihydropteroate synthase|uniref:Dihydropteroate synthase n=1 Tax=Zwartia hollandica TaxID=324606 RepID=A0A953T2Y5_9BURK|nr:dihydropteroate synthase [Zwartia hollandica]MBZ1350855.1 dihydropteroate synthase [Zwartia hollandica]
MHKVWQCGRYEFSLERPILMGIVNVTPDSFSDGGQHDQTDAAIAHARKLVAEGANILDIGGESTRPGAAPVALEAELARVMPVLEAVRGSGVAVSIDTCKAEVMRVVLAAGADIINDVTGMRSAQARAVVAAHPNCGICVMHMQGEPRTMQQDPQYEDVVRDVHEALLQQAHSLEQLGVARARISLDPGFGFGKTVAQNYQLIAELETIVSSGYPVVFGASRKSMLGAVTGRSVDQRLAGSIAAALAGVAHGAEVLRVHDVGETRDALIIWQSVKDAGNTV